MVALGLVEVDVVPVDGGLEQYDPTIDPFPVYDHPEGDGPRRVVKYIEVTEGAYYQVNMALNSGYQFDHCDSLIFEIWVGKRLEGIFADQQVYEDDSEEGPQHWMGCFGGVRKPDGGIHWLRCKYCHFNEPGHLPFT